jgi:hypothetical protein
VTEPANHSDDLDDAASGTSSPADIATAARSCAVIIVILSVIALLLCVALAIAKLV